MATCTPRSLLCALSLCSPPHRSPCVASRLHVQDSKHWIRKAEAPPMDGAVPLLALFVGGGGRCLHAFVYCLQRCGPAVCDSLFRLLQDSEVRWRWVCHHGLCRLRGQGEPPPLANYRCYSAAFAVLRGTAPLPKRQQLQQRRMHCPPLLRACRCCCLFCSGQQSADAPASPLQMFFEPVKNAIAGIPS